MNTEAMKLNKKSHFIPKNFAEVSFKNKFYIYSVFFLSDVNECEKKADCFANSICEDTPGSYECPCVSGYSGDGKVVSSFNSLAPVDPFTSMV